MGTLELIGLGYLLNFTIFVIMLIVSFVIGVIKMGEEEFRQQFIVLAQLDNDIKVLRAKLLEKGVKPLYQQDFIIFVPWSGLLTLLIFVWKLSSIGYAHYLYNMLSKRLQHLEETFNQYK